MIYAADIADEFTDLLSTTVNIAIQVLIFLVIMLLGWWVARLIRRWVRSGLQRLGFDRAADRGGLHRLLGQTSASDVVARLAVFAFMLVVLQLALGIFGPNEISFLLAEVIAWLPRLFVAVIIVVAAAAIAGWVRDIVADALGGLSYGRVVATAAQVMVLVLGIIAALNQVGVATAVTLPVLIAALATVAGVIIVGVGGGLVRPMQHRWERLLNRAETESTIAAEKVRAHRADRDANTTVGFDQPAYGQSRATAIDEKQRRATPANDGSAADAEQAGGEV
jgi:hypothetical protein